jgi:hypothetical protein
VLKAVKYSVHSSSENSSFYGYGIISDISESGIRLLTTIPLKVGEKVLIESNPLTKSAAVHWNDIGGLYYKAGLGFI